LDLTVLSAPGWTPLDPIQEDLDPRVEALLKHRFMDGTDDSPGR
jgi:hypothetical protein